MTFTSSAHVQRHVVIAGGGFAALEAALALRALAADRVRVTLVSPDPVLAYRPAATVETLGEIASRRYDLEAIAEDLGVQYCPARLEAVASQQKWVRLASGGRLEYDALVLAIGARARASIAGALTFCDQRDVALFRRVLEEVRSGVSRRLLFAMPPGPAWQLPLYELALLSAGYASRHRLPTEITIVSAEQAPLAEFGSDASELIRVVLAERGIRFFGDTVARGFGRDGALLPQVDPPLVADRLVATPELHGQRLTGIPADHLGFVPTDMVGRVHGLRDVYAAGDMTAFPIKQGGLGTQQADRVAHTIAASAGAPVKQLRSTSVLRALLLDGDDSLLLRTELDEFGHPGRATVERPDRRYLASSAKVFGRYLTPYLEERPVAGAAPAEAAPAAARGAVGG